MRYAHDLNNSVGANTVYHEMSGLSDPLIPRDQGAAQPEMVGPDSRDTWDHTRSKQMGSSAQCREHRKHQTDVADRGVNAPLLRTSEQDAVSIVLGAPEEAVAQALSAVLARFA